MYVHSSGLMPAKMVCVQSRPQHVLHPFKVWNVQELQELLERQGVPSHVQMGDV
jgi:hypothetical protein